MKRSLKIVFALLCVAAICFAQAGDASGTSPAAKEAPSAPTLTTPATPPETAANSAGPNKALAPQAASQPDTVSDQLPPARKPDAEAPVPPEKTEANSPGPKNAYVIGPLDVLYIRVWSNGNLSGPVDVSSDGMISMPLIGEVKADGLTARQLKEAITERLHNFLNTPEVDVTVAKVNSKRYFVYGGVGRPGEFPLVESTTVMDALSTVGGFRDFANTKKIYILRGTRKFNFNYKDVSKGKNLEQNILLQNGDRIFVPE